MRAHSHRHASSCYSSERTTMKRTHGALLACLLVCLFATNSGAGPRRVDGTTGRVQTLATRQGSDYVIEIDLPEGLASVQQAWLEVRMDVTARETGGVA